MQVQTQETQVKAIQLTPAQVLLVRLYRRWKQVEKTIGERIETAKAKIVLLCDSIPFAGYEGDKKVCSVSIQTRETLNVKKLLAEHPEHSALIATYTEESKPFAVVRLH